MTPPVKTDVQQLAAYMHQSFQNRENHAGDTIWVLKEDRPLWVADLVAAVHKYGDDWRFDCVRAAAGAVSDGQSCDDFAEGELNWYSEKLLRWLGSAPDRLQRCDSARDSVSTDALMTERIQAGQRAEASEVYSQVLAGLQERAEVEQTERGAARGAGS